MKGILLALLLGPFAWASPLLVASVGRAGLPPYEGTERVYRLEGLGCPTLRVGAPKIPHDILPCEQTIMIWRSVARSSSSHPMLAAQD